MPTTHHRSELNHTAEAVYEWHLRPGAFERLTPPWQDARVLGDRTGIAEGVVKTLSMRQGPVPIEWVARHHGFIPARRFIDEQVKGPFARWVHFHRFTPAEEGRSVLEDHIEYAAPFGLPVPVEPLLDRMFRFRHARTKADLDRHAAYPTRPLRIVVSGATGLIGTQLTAFWSTGGHRVDRLVRRSPAPGSTDIHWDPERGVLDAAALEGADAVVHLAGESISSRWSPESKRRILRSREAGTRLLAETLARLEHKPKVFLSASAIGFYGNREAPVDEESGSGDGFLAEVCRAWEAATLPAMEAGIRVVNVRLGVVLTPSGGALAQMLPPFRLGLGGAIGTGRQGFSWIALDDVVGAVHHALMTESLTGPVNLVAPESVSQADFAHTLGRVLHRPTLFPLPGPVVELAFGEMGREILLAGQFARPTRLAESGFAFRYPELEGALRAELGV